MKEIILSRNKVALVDDEDFEYLNQWKWTARPDKDYKIWYAIRRTSIVHKLIYMHRIILKLKDYQFDKIQVDHRNFNGLDNQKQNLRKATSQNNNQHARKINKTGYRGVQQLSKNTFRFQIRINGKTIWFSGYKTAYDAGMAYNTKAKEICGQFAILNKL